MGQLRNTGAEDLTLPPNVGKDAAPVRVRFRAMNGVTIRRRES